MCIVVGPQRITPLGASLCVLALFDYIWVLTKANKTMDIKEILSLSPTDAIRELSKKAVKITPWADIEKEYDPKKHAVLDKSKYPDIVTEAGKAEAVTRVVVPFQKLAVNRISELCFATPYRRSYQADSDGHKEAMKVLERIIRKCRIDSLNRMRSKKYFACCEVATIWNAVEKENTTYGFKSSLRLRQRTFSPMDGHKLYPLFDDYGDMIAFSVEYTSNGVRYFETLTDERRIVWRNDGREWEVESDEVHTIGKIPVVYMYRGAKFWEDSSSNVDEIEFSLSRNGNYLRRNSKPLLAVMSDKEEGGFDEEEELQEYEKDSNSEFRSIFALPKGSSMNYVTWDGAPDALKFHYQTLRSLFFDSLQLPDWSHSEMKSTPMSGESRKQLNIDGKLKVLDEAGELELFLSRELSVLSSFASIMRPDLAEAFASLDVDVEIVPYEITDEKDTISNVSQAKSSGLISQREAIAFLAWSSDPDKTLEEIREEEAYNAGEQSI